MKEFAKNNFPSAKYLDYALQVEKITVKKAENLILNVDGCITALFLDALTSSKQFTEEEIDEIIEIGYMNGLFALSRSIGIIGHILDQKRLGEELYRHPNDDILYLKRVKKNYLFNKTSLSATGTYRRPLYLKALLPNNKLYKRVLVPAFKRGFSSGRRKKQADDELIDFSKLKSKIKGLFKGKNTPAEPQKYSHQSSSSNQEKDSGEFISADFKQIKKNLKRTLNG